MTDLSLRLLHAMIICDHGDPMRIHHLLKVHEFSCLIAAGEGLDAGTLEVLEAAAIVHDIGIHVCEQKYGRCGGKLQEREGPAEARRMLEEQGCTPELTDRVCYLVGHHHTYTGIDGMDYQILVEADALTNLYEDFMEDAEHRKMAAVGLVRKVFRTATGKSLLQEIYGIDLQLA